MRRRFVAGNWKMNLNLATARELVAGIRTELASTGWSDTPNQPEVAICPPFTYLFPMAKAVAGSGIHLGSQDLYFERDGAFTGEISAAMVADTGARFAIVGHSERRHTIGHLEDDRMINRKVRAARAAKLTPILCIGETLGERQAGRTLEVLTYQVVAGLVGVELSAASELIVAYEPVWAIGTGQNATPAQAQEAHAHVRRELRRVVGPVADEIRVIYGGSVKPENAGEILAQPDVDGGLIGGASLKAGSFVGIVRAAVAAR